MELDGPPRKRRRRTESVQPSERLLNAIRDGDESECLEALSGDSASAIAIASTITTITEDEFDTCSAGEVSALMLAIECQAKWRATELSHARERIVRLLLEAADVCWARPHNGVTAVRIAAWHGLGEVVRLLAERGANVETPSNNGTTPVDTAAWNGHAEVVRVLAELGANVETPNNNGTTPVFIAAQEGHTKVVKVLAKLGANLKTRTHNGTTPVMIAVEMGHDEVARLLTQLGAGETEQEAAEREEQLLKELEDLEVRSQNRLSRVEPTSRSSSHPA